MRWFLHGKKAQAKAAGDSVTSYGPTRRFSVDTWHHAFFSSVPLGDRGMGRLGLLFHLYGLAWELARFGVRWWSVWGFVYRLRIQEVFELVIVVLVFEPE